VRRFSFFEQRQQFVLRAIKAAHAGVGLRPYDEVQADKAEFRCRRVHGRQAPPIDKAAADPALAKVRQDGRYPGSVEGKELGVRHFA
jgi:hypothetical protein